MIKIKIINNKKFVDMKSLFFCIIIIVLVIICVFVRIYIHNRKIQHAEDENGKAIDDNDVEVVEVEEIKVSELLKQKILDVIDEHIPFNTILTDVGLIINTGKNQFVLNGHSDRAHILATQLLKKDVNLMSIKELMGHSSILTTQTYLTLESEELKNAQGNLQDFEINPNNLPDSEYQTIAGYIKNKPDLFNIWKYNPMNQLTANALSGF